jgi:hypothetical protein
MIYLVINNDTIRMFYSENEMKAAGFTKAGLTVSEEKFNANGCYARLLDGKIVVGKTEAEIAEEERQTEIADSKAQLEAIDQQVGASRLVRDACLTLNAILGAMGVNDQMIAAQTDPAKKQALQSLKQFDFAANKGLEKLIELETEAQPVRERLNTLLNPVQAE